MSVTIVLSIPFISSGPYEHDFTWSAYLFSFPVQLCAKLPYFADQCKSLVDTVINYIDQNEDPENICKLITACPEPQPKLKALPVQFPGQVINGVKMKMFVDTLL